MPNGFLEAIIQGNIEKTKIFIEKNLSIIGSEERNTKRNCLHYSCIHGHVEILKLVVDKLKSLNTDRDYFDRKDVGFEESGKSPLFYAIKNKHKECAKIILENINVGKCTILYEVVGDPEIFEFSIEFLVEYGVVVDGFKNNIYKTPPLCLATYAQNITAVEYLLRNGANPNKRSDDGWTALHYACGFVYDYSYNDNQEQGNIEIVRILLGYGAKKSLRTYDGGQLPYDLTKNPEIKNLLLS